MLAPVETNGSSPPVLPNPEIVLKGKKGAMKVNDASQATGVPASPNRNPPGAGGRPVEWEVSSVAAGQLCSKCSRQKHSDLCEGIPGTAAGGSQGGRAATHDHLRGGHGLGAGPQAQACFGRNVTSDFFLRLLAKKKLRNQDDFQVFFVLLIWVALCPAVRPALVPQITG